MQNSDDGLSNYCSQTFVILDRWLNQVANEKGNEALTIARSALLNNMSANSSYYESMAIEAKKNGQIEFAARYSLLADIYNRLLH